MTGDENISVMIPVQIAHRDKIMLSRETFIIAITSDETDKIN